MTYEPHDRNIEELIQAVRDLPPTSTEVVDRFAGKLYLVSKDKKTVPEEEVLSVVDKLARRLRERTERFP